MLKRLLERLAMWMDENRTPTRLCERCDYFCGCYEVSNHGVCMMDGTVIDISGEHEPKVTYCYVWDKIKAGRVGVRGN
jgi:hypothetical protein